MRSIQKVVIQRAEGPSNDPIMRKATFKGDTAEEQGNDWLRQIARTAPKGDGYDKTDVWVTFSSGQEYQFRFDVQDTSLPDSDTDIRQHMRSRFLYLSRPEELRHIAADPHRLEYAQRNTAPEQKALAESMLALLDTDAEESVMKALEGEL
jgi:hypothetical protein